MESWATSLGNIGRTLSLPALGGALMMRTATKTFADFESEMAKVKARLDDGDKGFQNLWDSAIQFGKRTMFGATQAAQGMTLFAEAGFTSQQIAAVMKATLDLAAAGMVDVSEAASVARSAMVAFNLPAEQVPHLMDMIAKGATESAADVRDIGEAFKYAAPVAAAAGIPIQDLVGALTLLHDAGINADMAGTTVRGMLLALADPSVKAQETMTRMGIAVKDARGNFLPLVQIIANFENALRPLGSHARLNVLGSIFDARQAAGVAKLVDFGSKKLSSRIGTVYNSLGHAARVARIQMDTMTGAFRRLGGALEATAIAAIGTVRDKIVQITEAGRNVILFVEAWVIQNKEMAASMLKWMAIAIAIPPALISIAVALKVTSFAMAPIRPLLNGILTGIAAMASGAMSFVSALPALFASLMTPIGLISVAIVALAGYFLWSSGVAQSAWIGAGQLFSDVMRDIEDSWQGVKDAIAAGDTKLVMEIAALFFQLAWTRAIGYVRGLWEDAKYYANSVWIQMSSNISEMMLGAFYGVQIAWENVCNALIGIWNSVMNGIRQGWQGASNFVSRGVIHIMSLLDPSMDKEGALAALTDANNTASDSIQADYEQRRAANEKAHQDRLQKLRDERAAALASNEDIRNQRQGGADASHDDAINSINERIAAAKAGLADANARAAKAREASEKEDDPKKIPRGPGGFGRLPGVAALESKGPSVSGTFSARAAEGLGASDHGQQIAANTAKSADYLKTIAGNAGLGFA